MLKVRLLGQFSIRLDSQPVEIASRPAQSLLAYLILNAGSLHRREMLAGLLWPISSESSARGNLRQALWRIRKALPRPADSETAYLLADNFAIGFNAELDHWVDVFTLEKKLDDQWSADEMIECVEVYEGELLPGFYEDWVVLERERIRAVFENSMHVLMDRLIQEQRWRDALNWGERWIAHGETPEPAYRTLMIAHYQLGDSSSMIASYQRCQEALQEGLGVEPSAQTSDLYQRLSKGEIEAIATPSIQPEKTRAVELQIPSLLRPTFLDDEAEGVDIRRPPFVAREVEIAKLEQLLAETQSGKGQVALLTGIAGSGKSALVTEFARQSHEKHPDLIISMGICNALTGMGDPYLPFREILGLLTGDIEAKWLGGGIPTSQALRLWEFTPHTVRAVINEGPDLIDTLVSGAHLLSRVQLQQLEDSAWFSHLKRIVERNATRSHDPTADQRDLCEQYTKVLLALSRQAPLLLIIDDLQWADLASISLFFHVGRRIHENRIFIIGVHRPIEETTQAEQERHPLSKMVSEFKRTYGDIQIDLSQVDETERISFVNAFLDTEPNTFDTQFKRELYRHTGGHPLFTIELLRAMETRGDIIHDKKKRWMVGPSLNWIDLPGRVEGVVEERVSRIGEELQEVLTIASVEGEKFTAEVSANILNTDIREILSSLSRKLDQQHRLVAAQGIRRLDAQRISEYRFRHILFQKHFYNRLDAVERAYLHEHVGDELEQLYGNRASEIAVHLARHFDSAGVPEKAVMYLHIAAEQAKRLSAHEEAVHHLQRALDILHSMPPGEARTRQELTMQASLGVALVATKGYGAPEVERAFSMAHQLCDQIGDNPQLFSVLYGLRTFYLVRGNFRQAHELSEQLLRMAHATEDTDLLIEAHQAMGTVMFYLGDFLKSRMHLEQCMSLYRIDRHRTHAIQYGQDPGVTCLSYLALVLWCLGFPDQGLQKNREALALAEQAAHPFSLALALNFSALFYHFYRDLEKGFLRAQEAVRLSHDNNYPFWLAMGESILGVLMVEKGQEEGLVRLQKGLATWRATGAELGRPEFLTLLGWGLGLFGKANEGLETIEQAIVEGNRSGDRFIESELLRLKGELLMMQNVSPDEIESCYRTSIEVANKQRARLFELRATVNLSRLLLQQGNREKAYKPLQKIVQKIDEGLDSPDLRDAMSLMEELKTG